MNEWMKACFDPLITSTCSRLYEYKQDVEKKSFLAILMYICKHSGKV